MNQVFENMRRNARPSILVVEDNDINREILCEVLSDTYNVFEAEDGEVGLELLAAHYNELSLVLLDVYMPVCDGFEFLRRKRRDERYAAVPVIVATASDAIEDEIKCLELGANDFIVKPYNTQIMLNRVNNMIHLRESASIVNQLTWDSLTGLYSKVFFYRTVEDVFAAAPNESFDLVCSDIDNFKTLNDRYGEEACNRVLVMLADHMAQTLEDVIAGGRIGGDTFAFLTKHQDPESWESKLSSAANDMPVPNVGVKFGITEDVDHDVPVPQLCNRSMSAIDTVKDRGGFAIAFFDDEMHQRQLIEQVIRESMETALEQRQFSVFYQPKHNVQTNTIGGAEALVRWTHPLLGFVSPGLFIPVFERSGFITKLDMFVWEEVCRELRECIDKGLPIVPISVNASRLDFDVPDLPKKIAALADKYGIDRSLLHLELTETAYSENPEAVVEALKDVRELGFSAELDDFGSGYSSLASLNTLPLDVMKLDMSIVQQASELNDFRIVEAAINLAQVLDLKTVVEGVETEEEAKRVSDLGCDLIQGYFYSKPLRQDEFEEYLRR